MSIRYLDTFSNPRSIAVIGASPHEGRLGERIWRALWRGCRRDDGTFQPFVGHVWPVNPHHEVLDGQRVFHRLRQLPAVPELAVIATPAAAVTDVVTELALMGTRTVLVLTQGMSKTQQQAMLNAGQRHRVRVLGPHRCGLIVPHLGLNASLSPLGALSGELALLSQSSALATAMLDWASTRGIGFSQVVMLGERADIDLSDWLDHLGSDPRTRAILVYMEQAEQARKFLSASRAASRNKPVIVVKPGGAPMGEPGLGLPLEGAPFAAEAVFDAAVARAGMLRVPTLPDLLLAAEILSRCRDTCATALCIVGTSTGLAALAEQAAQHAGVEAQSVVLPDDAPAATIIDTVAHLLQHHPDRMVLWVHAPSVDAAHTTALAEQMLPIVRTQTQRVLGCWLGDDTVAEARALWRRAGVPDFSTPEAAIRAWKLLHTHRHHQTQLLQTPARHNPPVCDTAVLQAHLEALCPSSPHIAARPPVVVENEAALRLLRVAGWPVRATTPATSTEGGLRILMQVRTDAVFGPMLALGVGEAGQERYALALPPLNTALAMTALAVSNIPLGVSVGVLDRLCEAWVALSEWLLLLDVTCCGEADIELSVTATTWVVQRARVALSRCALDTHDPNSTHFAIQPYPNHLVQTQDWHGQALTIRPIRPEDEAQHLAFLRQLSPEDIRMRIFHSRRSIDHRELARLTQIDYAREMALIATVVEHDGPATLGTVRAMIAPDNDTAEFGVIVRSDLKHGGLGRRLMQALIAHLQTRGTRRLVGTVLRSNAAMRQLAQRLGFTEHLPTEAGQDEHLCMVELCLQEPTRRFDVAQEVRLVPRGNPSYTEGLLHPPSTGHSQHS